MFRTFAFSAAALAFLTPQSLPAQQSGRGQLQSAFAAKGPSIGAELPDVSGFTADGEPFNLRDLRGDYTVLVFGCLT